MATVCGVRCVRCVWRRSGLAKVAWDMATAPCGCVLLDFVAESAEHRELHFIKYKDIVFSMVFFQRANTRVYAYLIYLYDALISYLSEISCRRPLLCCAADNRSFWCFGFSALHHRGVRIAHIGTTRPRPHSPRPLRIPLTLRHETAVVSSFKMGLISPPPTYTLMQKIPYACT
jgi:hypothetical protein